MSCWYDNRQTCTVHLSYDVAYGVMTQTRNLPLICNDPNDKRKQQPTMRHHQSPCHQRRPCHVSIMPMPSYSNAIVGVVRNRVWLAIPRGYLHQCSSQRGVNAIADNGNDRNHCRASLQRRPRVTTIAAPCRQQFTVSPKRYQRIPDGRPLNVGKRQRPWLYSAFRDIRRNDVSHLNYIDNAT